MFKKTTSVLFFFVALAAALLSGCTSYSKQFANAAGPIAKNIAATMNGYTAEMPAESPERVATEAKVSQFVTNVEAGDRDATQQIWYAPQGIRQTYIAFLNDDPEYDLPQNASALQIQLNTVNVFDYILTIKPEPPAIEPIK